MHMLIIRCEVSSSFNFQFSIFQFLFSLNLIEVFPLGRVRNSSLSVRDIITKYFTVTESIQINIAHNKKISASKMANVEVTITSFSEGDASRIFYDTTEETTFSNPKPEVSLIMTTLASENNIIFLTKSKPESKFTSSEGVVSFSTHFLNTEILNVEIEQTKSPLMSEDFMLTIYKFSEINSTSYHK